ncbi:hypothetical protein TNCV_3504631 [Trichonephila clavipes]|uniref:Uncharacterized protein n=1 Tax=Trichonephila clavipes TaxID=2585209 RepID=A0A8X6S8T5_TRICX|nr:hypothetical protein TNCV_3504631 [Trichonephila clavipes]
MGSETYITFFDVTTRQESKVWVFVDDPTPTMANGKSNVGHFRQKYRIGHSHQVGRIEGSNSKLAYQGNSTGPVRAYPIRTYRPREALLSPSAGPEGVKNKSFLSNNSK